MCGSDWPWKDAARLPACLHIQLWTCFLGPSKGGRHLLVRPQVHTTEWPGGAIRGQLHWAASPGNDVLSVYNDLSGSAGGGGDGGTSDATRGCGGGFGLRLLALALAAAVALLV